jgi:MscS family membrane protein
VTKVKENALAGLGKHTPDVTSVHALAKLGRLAIVAVGTLLVLQVLGVPLSGVVAFGGGSALVVGIAAKDLLANFFGGWVVIMDKPFKVGDWISSPDKHIEGTVEYIGWRSTRIRTFDKRPLYVPNSMFTTISIENPSRMKNRRIKTVMGIRYDDANKLSGITGDIEAMLAAHPDIDQTTTTFVKLINFGHSSLDIQIYTFTKTTDWVEFQSIQQDVFLKMIEIVSNHQAEVAFPTQTLEMPKGLHMLNNDKGVASI